MGFSDGEISAPSLPRCAPSECRGTGNGSFQVPRIAFPAVCWPDCRLLPDDTDVLCLLALLPLGDLELYDLTLLQIPKPLTGNPGVMDENILPFLWSDEAIPFLPIEPLDRAFWHTLFLPPLGPVALRYA